jgi:hypothetical protein
MSVAGVDVTTTAATTTTSTSPSIASLAEQMRVAAEHEWLYQRIQVFWAANGVTTKRSGTVLAIRWLDSAVTNATDVRQMEALAVRSLAASVRFDDDKTTVYDSELVADLSHYQEDDNDGIEEEEETQIDRKSFLHRVNRPHSTKSFFFFFFFFFFALFFSVCLLQHLRRFLCDCRAVEHSLSIQLVQTCAKHSRRGRRRHQRHH